MTVSGRRSGLLIPLFSVPSDTSWGIGDIGDSSHVMSWLAAAGQRVLQLLPLNEMAPGQQSPYSAISAMAIDPIYISRRWRSRSSSTPAASDRSTANECGRARTGAHGAVRSVRRAIRRLKEHALRRAFERFVEAEVGGRHGARSRFTAFLDEQAWWIDEYAFFRAVHATRRGAAVDGWPASLRRRETPALADAKYCDSPAK